ncbi:LuxR family transcriptional regulator [Micromonospora sp. WMMC241]|uniref:helix-turn-helix transcriptional regulator n=1 Tax=Micromonospora sp. WMMC241 TaxID=3015159 RepID=UPI0022B70D3C|nr:LuxR family transcriptional regulator [Micromonospora sp. WMMC241]MCZ7437041.1 LuxR family transcriptional regulator [Micromonospora sp. WMMC241]
MRGRDDECAAIRRLLDQADGGALLCHGPPGSGRSALLAYARREGGDRAVLTGAGLVDEAALPYAGLHRLLDPVLDAARALPTRQRRLLRRALNGGECPSDQRLALAAAVRSVLAATARDRPLLCTVDDVDLGDRQTAWTLAVVARRLRRLPVTLLLTAGVPAPVDGIPAHRLRPLDPHQCRALLADRRDPPPPARVAAALAALSGGNPQALADLAEALTPAQWQGEEPLPDAPPADGALGAAYRARLDRLPASTRRMVLLAALDTDDDPHTLVHAARAAGLTVDALAPAEAAGLLRTGPAGVTFPHPLARAMIEAVAPLAEMRAAHLLLAGVQGIGRLRRTLHRAAVADGPDPALAAELEAAAERTTERARAIAALRRAAELTAEPARAAERMVAAARHAWAGGDPAQARDLLRRLPTAAASGPVDLLRGDIQLRCEAPGAAVATLLAAADALAATDRRQALLALVRAGEAICVTGDHYRYAEVARRAEALRGTGDPPDVELLATFATGVGATLRGDHAWGGPALRRVVVLGGRLAGPAPSPAALVCAAAAGLLVAVDGAAHDLAGRAVASTRARGELSLLPRALELRAVAEYWLGRHELAAETAREGLRVARSTGQDACAQVHLGILAVLAAVRADRAAALAWIAEIGDRAASGSRPDAYARWALGVLDLVDGRHADAAARLAALARVGTGRGQVLVQVMATPYLVEAAAHDGGRPTAALAVFDHWASSTVSTSRRALAARCRALLAPRGGAEAEREFRTALRLHPADTDRFERARTELLFGCELRRSRRPRDARAHLHRAREAFLLLGATVWAERAGEELRAAGESVGPVRRPPELLLTGQQLHIARLVAEGATNREIAVRMSLSTRTVDHHLRNVFHRLGVRSRTELARLLA